MKREDEDGKKLLINVPLRQMTFSRERDTKARNVGKQAQMTPRFISIWAQIEAPRSPISMQKDKSDQPLVI